MDAIVNILEDFSRSEPLPNYWTLILITKGESYCKIKGQELECHQGIVIIPSGFVKEDLRCCDGFDGSIIQIPDNLITGSKSPVSGEFIDKVVQHPYLDLSSDDSKNDLAMASNYWFLIKTALQDIDNVYSRIEIVNLCKALMKFCEKHYN